MASRRSPDSAFGLALLGLGIACWGWGISDALLAIAGVLIALTALLSWGWGRWCLAQVSFARRLEHSRATFGERLEMEIEVVNDKLLPLAWLHVRDGAPSRLPVEGSRPAGRRRELHLVLAMLPYQRIRRRVLVECTERGVHQFGPTTLRSGSPFGTHERHFEVRDEASLLVYPKVVPLSATPLTSRVPLGERRVRQSVALDPTRVIGVRPYVTGDPVRFVDWRATARSGDTDLLVRVHEPAATPSVALFVELLPARGMTRRAGGDMVELLVSVAASVASHLLSEGVATGLYTTGTARGVPVAVPPSRDPGMRTTMLELLAQVTPSGGVPLPDALVRTRHRMGVSVLVVAADFPPATCSALADVHRRSSVGALWVGPAAAQPGPGGPAATGPGPAATQPGPGATRTRRGNGVPPPSELVDAWWQVAADDAWRDWSMLNLAERR